MRYLGVNDQEPACPNEETDHASFKHRRYAIGGVGVLGMRILLSGSTKIMAQHKCDKHTCMDRLGRRGAASFESLS
jgi:hypothetical protein